MGGVIPLCDGVETRMRRVGGTMESTGQESKGYRQRREERRRQEILLQAAYVLAEQGYHGVTLEAIASRLEMTKGSLYYYFPDKQEILSLVLKRGAQTAIDYITKAIDAEASPVDRLHQWVDAHIRFVCHEMPYSVTLLQTEAILDNPAHEEVEKMLHHYDKMLDRILEEGMAQGLFMTLPVRATRNFILGALNWVPRWYLEEGTLQLEELIAVYRGHILRLVGYRQINET